MAYYLFYDQWSWNSGESPFHCSYQFNLIIAHQSLIDFMGFFTIIEEYVTTIDVNPATF